jgi:hypothetical protein
MIDPIRQATTVLIVRVIARMLGVAGAGAAQQDQLLDAIEPDPAF